MPLAPLPTEAVTLGAVARDWRAAVLLAGDALERSGATTAAYGARMVAVVEEFGAYIVITPGLALAHARPGRDVLRDGLSVVTLARPVEFGHAHNDPVGVVVGLAARSADEHIATVAALARAFDDRTAVRRLTEATDPAEVRSILGAVPELTRPIPGQQRPAPAGTARPSTVS